MFPESDFFTWDEVLVFYRQSKCVLKTEKDLCELAHFSYGIHRGGAFTPVKCRLCGYKCDTEEVARLT